MNDGLLLKISKIAAIAYFALIVVVCLASFYFEFHDYQVNNPRIGDTYACDFHMRMNEAQCVRDGVNPYEVWHGDITRMPYVSNSRQDLWTPERCEFINAYTPWSYPIIMPLTFVSRITAWRVYYFLMILCMVALGGCGYFYGGKIGGGLASRLFLSALAVSIPFSMNYNLLAGNYCILVSVAVVAMALLLSHGHDVLAGIAWSVAMIKPHMGAYLVIPLLLCGKVKTCFVAGCTCLVLACFSSWLCGTSPIMLGIQSVKASSWSFIGCGLMPSTIVGTLASFGVSTDVLSGISGIIGAILCIFLTLLVRNSSSWFVRLVPAAICAVTCNYAHGYNFCLNALLLIAIGEMLIKSKDKIRAAMICAVPAFFAFRLYDCVAYVVRQKHELLSSLGVWPWGKIPDALAYALYTWWSFGLLLSVIAWICLLRKSDDCCSVC